MSEPTSSPTPRRARAAAILTSALVLGLLPNALCRAQTTRPLISPSLTLPGTTWETATPESQGLDGATLATAIANLPSPANQGPLMVIANGRLVHSVGNIAEPRDLFSCSKAVTAMVVARLIEEGRIPNLDRLVPNTVRGAWSSYPGDATFRMFLTMTSDYGLPSPRSPGNRHAYNNHGIDFVGEHVSRTYYGIGPDRMHDVVQRAMLVQLGRQDAVSFNGQWGGWYGGLRMSVRDLGRLGLLLLRDGVWNGQRLLADEMTGGLFHNQIPSTSTRYQSSITNESSMWNQQAVTDRLADSFSFGLWRVGPTRTGGSFGAAAMDGYRGKRVLMCPRGSLPNPDLELMLVCLPNLRNEGPATTLYLDALLRSVRVPEHHPEHDPHCLTETFDDDTLGRLERSFGSLSLQGGTLGFVSPGRVLMPDEPVDDVSLVFAVRPGIPAGARVGTVLRARTEGEGAFVPTGTQTYVALEHVAAGGLRVTVAHPRNGAITWHRGPILARARPADTLVVRIDVAGDRVRASVNGEDALGATGYSGIPSPFGGGFFSLQSSAHTQPIGIDYLLMRSAYGPIGQVSIDSRGEHTIAFLAPDHLGNLPAGAFQIEYDDLVLDASVLPAVIPWVWSTVVAAEPDHLILSSTNAPVALEAGKSLVIQVGSGREGELLR